MTIPRSDCYNLEDRLPLFKFGKAGSSFGFSVAQHRLTKSKTSEIILKIIRLLDFTICVTEKNELLCRYGVQRFVTC